MLRWLPGLNKVIFWDKISMLLHKQFHSKGQGSLKRQYKCRLAEIKHSQLIPKTYSLFILSNHQHIKIIVQGQIAVFINEAVGAAFLRNI